MKEAVECYKIALEKNPTLWVAFEKIVKISEFVNNQFESIPNLFHDHKILGLKKNISMNTLHKILFKDRKLWGKESLNNSTTFSSKGQAKTGSEMDMETLTNNPPVPGVGAGNTGTRIETRYSNLLNNSSNNPVSNAGKNSPFSRYGGPRERKDVSKRSSNSNLQNTRDFAGVIGGQTPGGGLNILNTSNTNIGNANISNSSLLQSSSLFQKELLNTGNGASNVADNYTLSDILTKLAKAYYLMINYKSHQAIETFQSLPKKHYTTGFVLTSLGRCHMDLGLNKEAEKFFSEAHKKEPYRLEGMEYYSSCLWSLQKHSELSELALSCIEKNPFASEAWIAIGNCYSLQREHDTALNFFNRAIQ